MGLGILNISVDSPDHTYKFTPEDLSYNDMESLVEILLEKVLGIDNAILEIDDNDDTPINQQTKTNYNYSLYYKELKVENMEMLYHTEKNNDFFYNKIYKKNIVLEIITPPPISIS